MIERLEIAGVHLNLDEDLEKYTRKKIGQLDRYAPRNARESMHAEVKLKESQGKKKNKFTCETILHLPKETLMTSEATINIYAAIDIVETKLTQQIKKYKNKHQNPKLYRRIKNRFKRNRSTV